jgi:uncharacterized protein YkwD
VTYARTLLCTAVCAGALLALPPAAGGTDAPRSVVDGINAFRATQGRPAVRLSGRLSRSALAYARYLMRRGVFGHSARIRASRVFWEVGEVLELHPGDRARPDHAVRQWTRSPAHRWVMLNPAFRWVGAARVWGEFRGEPTSIWVVHFGAL